jgi:hypothetical protein
MLLKRTAAICFAIAFLMAIVLFAGYGRSFMSPGTARILFLIFGASGLLLNLLSFRFSKQDAGFNLVYWFGSIILFIGLVFMMMHWPYGFYILLAGLFTVGISFIIPSGLLDKKEKNDEILDN